MDTPAGGGWGGLTEVIGVHDETGFDISGVRVWQVIFSEQAIQVNGKRPSGALWIWDD